MTPCSVAAGALEGVGPISAASSVEAGSDGHRHHGVEAPADETVGAPCPCGCESDGSNAPAAKRLATAVLLKLDFEPPRAEVVQPLPLVASLVEGQRELPDPIPIPS